MTKSMETSRGARLPRSARRKQLLEAAQELFVANGYHAAAMDDIAERAGVSKPVLYQHFPGKLELYLALIDEQAQALVGAIRSALADTDNNQQRVHGVLSAYFDFVDGSGPGAPGAFRLIFETDLGNDPAVRERVGWVEREILQAVADTVAADTSLDRARAELLAVALTGAAELVARWWLDSNKPVPKHEAVALMESLQWRGISHFPLHGEHAAGAERPETDSPLD